MSKGAALGGVLLGLVLILPLALIGFLTAGQQTAPPADCAPASTTDVLLGDNVSYASLDKEQSGNAQTIVSVGIQLGVPEQGWVIAIATAMQESTLRNLDYGDRDSIGLFQQRTSTGWGTLEQIADPVLSSRAFYGRADHTGNTGLLDIPGWQSMPLTVAAQAVQRSGFPDAYAKWETLAREVVAQVAADAGPQVETVVPAAAEADDPKKVGPIRLVQANIPGRSADFRGSLAKVVGVDPDFVTLNEMTHKAKADYTPAGYDSWRAPRGNTGVQSMSAVVLWRLDRWTLVDSGRVMMVPNGPQKWDDGRAANWATLSSADLGQVSVVAVHHMINPAKYGPNRPLRRELYREGMEEVAALVAALSELGPVFVSGDMNSQYGANDPWGPRKVLGEVGMKATFDVHGATATHIGGGTIDYVFFQPSAATSTRQWTTRLASDHLMLGADFTTAPGTVAPVSAACVAGGGTEQVAYSTGNGDWVFPVAQPYTFSAGFPNYSDGRYHGGQDLAAPEGTTIFAASDGVASFVGCSADGCSESYGVLTKITHPGGVETLYAHQSEQLVTQGEQVTAGQPIGKVGTTGNSTGNHLHFEVREAGVPQDPMAWLRAHGVTP